MSVGSVDGFSGLRYLRVVVIVFSEFYFPSLSSLFLSPPLLTHHPFIIIIILIVIYLLYYAFPIPIIECPATEFRYMFKNLFVLSKYVINKY